MAYSRTQRVYHWISAALILLMAGTGLAYTYELAGDGAMRMHQFAGQVLIGVIVLRIVARLRRGGPVPRNGWQGMLAQGVHLLLYATMIAFVVTGYVSASAETDNVLLAPVSLGFARSDTGELLLEIHYLLKWALLALLSLHVAGALKHHFVDRDDTLRQMTFTQPKG